MRMISLLKRLRAPQRNFSLSPGDLFKFRLDDGNYSNLTYQAVRIRIVNGSAIVDGESTLNSVVVARVSRPVNSVVRRVESQT